MNGAAVHETGALSESGPGRRLGRPGKAAQPAG
jgi:hypothetical protein